MNIIWKTNREQYASGENAFSGKIKIGSYRFNSISKSPQYLVFFMFKGDKLPPEGADTIEECKNIVEKAFKEFMIELGYPKAQEQSDLVKEIELMLSNKEDVSGLSVLETEILSKIQKCK